MTGTVNVVHAIDTEGPIYESVQATFERLEEILGVKIKPSIWYGYFLNFKKYDSI